MNIVVVSIFFFVSVLGELTCQPGQVYVKLYKTNGPYPQEDRIQIVDGETECIRAGYSPTFSGTLWTGEYCIPASTNNQYTIKLIDTYGDAWGDGSHVKVQGEYGNYFFDGALYSGFEQDYPLSLYYPVPMFSEWKFVFNSISGNWKDSSFDDSQWNTVTLGNVEIPVTGPQFFRKSFTSITGIAAYELSLYYRFGIVAYINGEEVYRDNMPNGEILPTTAATGSYQISNYHSVIRPGSEVGTTNAVLAVEIHFVTLPQTFVDFDAYMALYTPSVKDTDCMVYADVSTVTVDGEEKSMVFDFKLQTAYSVSTLPLVADYNFQGATPYINGLMIYPYSAYTQSPKEFVLEGAYSPSGPFTTVINISSASYSQMQFYQFSGYFNAAPYSNYRLRITRTETTPLKLYEVQPVICATKIPSSLSFEPSAYTAIAPYQTVSIRPTLPEFSNCVITPLPTAGLTFDAATCTLSGAVASATPLVSYTVTSTMAGQQFSGSFTLEFNSCQDNFIRLVRTYQDKPNMEYYNVIDLATNQTIYSVAKNSGQPASTVVEAYLCTTATKIEIETFTSSSYWAAQSYLYVHHLFDAQNYETILRAHRDNNYQYPSSFYINIGYVVPAHSTWNYKMGEVPTNWYNNEMTGFTPKPTSGYPDSTNQIQLYKKQFTIDSLNNVAGIVISLKYQYGVLIYLNGHEVFRKGITGTLSTESYATTSLSDVKYRQISLPLGGNYLGSTFTNFVTSGSNTIAIALVSGSTSMKSSTFDCAIRLMGDNTVIRNFDYTAEMTSSLSDNCIYVFANHYRYFCVHNSCSDHYIDITFDNDRHEWISSVALKVDYTQTADQPTGFVLLGKNAEDTEWTEIKTYRGLTWSQRGQRNRYWTLSTQAFNQYRFTNFTGNAYNCYWKMASIELIRDDVTMSVPDLSYEDVSVYRNIEMAELYPSSDYYADFTINPALPEGIVIDSNTGMISGTATNLMNPQEYTVSAKRFNGETTSCTFTFSVEICTGGKSLITLVLRSDNFPGEMRYKLFEGKGTSGNILLSATSVPVKNALFYVDQCLDNGFYTYELSDSSDGWFDPAGYYLSVDVGAMKFAAGQVWAKSTDPNPPVYSFSSYLPFQVEYSDWKVYMNGELESNWKEIDYDDSTWSVMKAADIGTTESTTVYIRKDITLDDATQYNVLNVRINYIGGVVAYFNGRKVARFNIEENFDYDTESIAIHDSTTFSKFHIILDTSGAVTGKNVIAFEIHRPRETSSAIPVVFDATGVFDVNDCAYVLDSYSSILGTETKDGSNLADLLDMDPTTGAIQDNTIGTYFEWTVENLEGSKFNYLGVGSRSSVSGWGFSVYVRDDTTDPYNSIFAEVNIALKSLYISKFETAVAIAGYNQVKIEYDVVPSSDPKVFDYLKFYCKASGEGVCPAVDGYPAVADGQISPGECEYGYRGYSYRECHNNVLGEVKTEHCVLKTPSDIQYDAISYTLVLDTQVTIAAPKYKNIITKFSLAPGAELPAGLVLDEKTGAITGVPTSVANLKAFTIYGENEQGSTEVEISISIRKGECRAEGNFPKAFIGETVTFECSTQGSYIGTQKRTCKLGSRDGEWEKVQGTCVSIVLLVVVIIIVVIIIIVIIVIIVKTHKKKVKAVGGTKGKKMPTKAVQAPKKGSKV